VKKADAVRLTVAYLLIAASGGDAETSTAKPKPGAAAGAATPADVPARGWLDIARSVWTKIGKNRVIAVAAGLTFYDILAIFPAVTALVSIYGLFADPATIQNQLTHLSGVLPDGAISVIGDQVQRIAAQGNGTLGFAFMSGLAVALWSANAGVKALFDALNVAYETEETRGFFPPERDLLVVHNFSRRSSARRAVLNSGPTLGAGARFLRLRIRRDDTSMA
jgi:Virulence factor BrkB